MDYDILIKNAVLIDGSGCSCPYAGSGSQRGHA